MKVSLERILLTILILAVIGVGTVFILAGATWNFLHKATIGTEPTPAILLKLEREFEDLPYCPGEWIEFGMDIDPLRLPFIGHAVMTLWDRDHTRTAIAHKRSEQEDVIYRNGEAIRIPGRFYVPYTDRYGDPILAGQYEIRLGLVAEGASPAVVGLPFTIPKTCLAKDRKGN